MNTVGPSDSGRRTLSHATADALGGLLDRLDRLDPLLSLPDHPTAAVPPIAFSRYALRSRLGAGRFGLVLLGTDPALGRAVVVKVPQPTVLADPGLVGRFAREGMAAARLDHPGIVPVFEAGTAGGLPYLSAGYVPGPTLAGWLKDHPGPMPPRDAAGLVRAVAAAVHHAHERGVLHCDLSPANILLNPTGGPAETLTGFAPQVTDFGLARLLDDDPALTKTFQVAGTPLYMAPEQAAGDRRNLTARSDVYAVGAMLYELLTGRPPFQGGSANEVLARVIAGQPVPVRRVRPALPRDLAAVCQKCLERRPGDRYESAAALEADLGRFLTGKPVAARPVSAAVRAGRWAAAHPAVCGLLLLAGLTTAAAVGLAADGWRREVQADADDRVRDAEQRALEARAAAAEFHAVLGRVRQRRLTCSPQWAAANRADLRALPPFDRESEAVRTEAAAVAGAIDLGEPREVLRTFRGYATAYSPDGRTLAVSANASDLFGISVRLIDPTTGTVGRTLRGPADQAWELSAARTDRAWSLAFSPDGRWLAAGMRSGWVCVWELPAPGAEPAARWRHAPFDGSPANDRVNRVTFDTAGRLWSGNDRTAVAWDPGRGWAEADRLAGYLCRPTGGTLDADRPTSTDAVPVQAGQALVHRPTERTLAVIGPDDQPTARLESPDNDDADDSSITDLAVTPDAGVLVAAAEHAGHLKLWDLVGGRLLSARTLNPGSLRLAVRPDGRELAVVENQRVLLFPLSRPACDAVGLHPDPLDDADLTPNGRWLATTASPSGHTSVHAVRDLTRSFTDPPAFRAADDGPSGNSRRRLAVSPDGRTVVTHSNRYARQWTAADGGFVNLGQPTDTRAFRMAADGTLWHVGGTLVSAWPPGGPGWTKPAGGPVSSLLAGPDEGLVGRIDGTLLRFSPAGDRRATDKLSDAALTDLARSGDRLLVGTADGQVLMIGPDGAKRTIDAHTDTIWAIAVAPGGGFATGSADRTVRLWDAAGRPLLTLPQMRPVRRLFWSPDGRLLYVLAEGERAVRRWHLDRLNEAFAEMKLGPIGP